MSRGERSRSTDAPHHRAAPTSRGNPTADSFDSIASAPHAQPVVTMNALRCSRPETTSRIPVKVNPADRRSGEPEIHATLSTCTGWTTNTATAIEAVTRSIPKRSMTNHASIATVVWRARLARCQPTIDSTPNKSLHPASQRMNTGRQ
jgi:hypothetical protein